MASDGEARKRRVLVGLEKATLGGATWLGRRIRAGSVAHILPRPKPRMEEELAAIASAAGDNRALSVLKPIGLSLRGPSSGLHSFARLIETRIGVSKPTLVVVDGLLAAMPRGVDTAQDVIELGAALRAMAMTLDALVLVAHDLAVDGALVGHARLADAFDAVIVARAEVATGQDVLALRTASAAEAELIDEGPTLAGLPRMDTNAIDRRRFDRLPIAIRLAVETGGVDVIARTVDLSEDGMLVTELPAELAPTGALLTAKLHGVGSCRARVTARSSDGVHCQFAAMAPAAREALESLLVAERARVRDRARAVQDVAWDIGQALEHALVSGDLGIEDLFEPSYRRIAVGGTAAIAASYQRAIESILAPRLGGLDARRTDLTGCAVLDRRAHPAFALSLSKARVADRVFANAARNCRPLLVQKIERAPGRVDLDISSPIRVMGHHWGCVAARFAEL